MATYLNGSFSSLEPGDILDFEYTGSVQEVELLPGEYKLECWGAEGSVGDGGGTTGKGGYTTGVLTLTDSKSIYIYIGGKGISGATTAIGGFNGGGKGYSSQGRNMGSGGGGSDIRIDQDSLYARVIVAGGGGGGNDSSSTYLGGHAGGLQGLRGTDLSATATGSDRGGGGGSQTEGGNARTTTSWDSTYVNTIFKGSFGQGGGAVTTSTYYTNGGGGGWYGGGAGGPDGGAGGGSGYVYTNSTASNYPSGCLLNSDYYLDEANIIAGNQSFLSPSGTTETGHSGNGFVRITVLDIIGELDYTVYNIDDIAIPNQTINFEYTGSVQTTILKAGQYKLECWGAQGGTYSSYTGGLGGYSTGIITLSVPTTIYCYVGGQGSSTDTTAGFNGGGAGIVSGRGGGGASDIRIGQDSLYARVIVAGGGGGAGVTSGNVYPAGCGGGIYGGDGYYNSTDGSANQKTGSNRSGGGGGPTYAGITWSTGASASFGAGSNASGYSCGGGGGGWYGGAGAYDSDSDSDGRYGGGGSGYVYTESTATNYPEGCLLDPSIYLTNAETISGKESFLSPAGQLETGHTSNGYIRIISLNPPEEYIPPTLEPKDKIKCNYNGSKRAVQLPAGCYNIKCYGAQGGNAKASGGLGGYTTGILKLDGTETLYIYVGGQGTSTVDTSNNAKGGFNGGGDARTSSTSYHTGSGGGASDIRINYDSLYARAIVAGGGGGSGGYTTAMNGGSGGGIEGIWGKQTSTSYYHGKGGTQTTAGISYYGTSSNSTIYFTLANFGLGGSATTSSYEYRSGGGGGWYGGGGADFSGAGGGSGYVWTPESASNYPTGCLLDEDHYIVNGHLQTGKRSGNGYIELEYLGNINLINIDDIAEKSSLLDFEYTGAAQSVTLKPGTYKLECWGAEGGYRSSNTYSGKGGYSVGTITLATQTNIYIYVGGSGNSVEAATSMIYPGGFNGGGYRYNFKGGGGASDIRIGQDSLYARVIVAGGGGSDGSSNYKGGNAGGITGVRGSFGYGSYGYGGTQNASTYTTLAYISSQGITNNSTNCAAGFGFGGFGCSANSGYGGAGGGGWYGGQGTYPDGSGDDDGGGGGGSGYVYTSSTASNYPSGCLLDSSMYLTDAETISGDNSFNSPDEEPETGHTGDGYVRITPITIINDTPEQSPKLKLKKGDIIYSYYNGKKRQVNLPKGLYQIETYGASGGNGAYSYGGKGGYSKGIIQLTDKNTSVYVYSGGQGRKTTSVNTIIKGGFNGGGNAYSNSTNLYGGSGGGASDIRIGQDSLYARIITAGGGGGGGQYNDTGYASNIQGGAGGGFSGTDGGELNTSYLAGKAGTQTTAGNSYYNTTVNSTTYCTPASFGIGGSQKSGYLGSGGGGGWYGGGSSYYSGGGGGSGYIYVEDTASNYPSGCLLNASMYLTNASTTADIQEGNGYIQFTVIKASGLNGRVKINNEWKEIDSLLIKQNNEWKEIDSVLLKVNNTWKET